eukprot:NODE_1599_length_1890_cov_33.275608_g1351_i0.p1 GENE.NODE_1599_length_1890_cov_33.275608_g1351_i0~~NODE_1599_length_1890_cov_33.275608_g1351_i0.p1  ORF type:complete len:571 (+),score=141.15 NODE_1599_length_1890_cov_33.275608_g1351_i0:89-1801(+)
MRIKLDMSALQPPLSNSKCWFFVGPSITDISKLKLSIIQFFNIPHVNISLNLDGFEVINGPIDIINDGELLVVTSEHDNITTKQVIPVPQPITPTITTNINNKDTEKKVIKPAAKKRPLSDTSSDSSSDVSPPKRPTPKPKPPTTTNTTTTTTTKASEAPPFPVRPPSLLNKPKPSTASKPAANTSTPGGCMLKAFTRKESSSSDSDTSSSVTPPKPKSKVSPKPQPTSQETKPNNTNSVSTTPEKSDSTKPYNFKLTCGKLRKGKMKKLMSSGIEETDAFLKSINTHQIFNSDDSDNTPNTKPKDEPKSRFEKEQQKFVETYKEQQKEKQAAVDKINQRLSQAPKPAPIHIAEAKPTIPEEPEKDYSENPLLLRVPVEGDILAYKTIILKNQSPQPSKYKEAEVVKVESGAVTLKILYPIYDYNEEDREDEEEGVEKEPVKIEGTTVTFPIRGLVKTKLLKSQPNAPPNDTPPAPKTEKQPKKEAPKKDTVTNNPTKANISTRFSHSARGQQLLGTSSALAFLRQQVNKIHDKTQSNEPTTPNTPTTNSTSEISSQSSPAPQKPESSST